MNVKKNENEPLVAEIVPLDDAAQLSLFLDQTPLKIAEAITGGLALGKAELLAAGGRVLQGYLKGNFAKQFGREFKKLVEEGKVKEDYASTKFGIKSLSDLLLLIDESVDVEKIEAVKAMFYATLTVNISASDEILNYQLFGIIKELNSSQILVLRTAYRLGLENKLAKSTGLTSKNWAYAVADGIGHSVSELVLREENELLSKQLIGKTDAGLYVGWGLTKLGVRFCENMDTFYPLK